MAQFKPYKVTSDKLDDLSAREGQLIVVPDKKRIYMDTNSYKSGRVLLSDAQDVIDLNLEGINKLLSNIQAPDFENSSYFYFKKDGRELSATNAPYPVQQGFKITFTENYKLKIKYSIDLKKVRNSYLDIVINDNVTTLATAASEEITDELIYNFRTGDTFQVKTALGQALQEPYAKFEFFIINYPEYLSTRENYTEDQIYIPTYPGSPATKKYVDDRVAENATIDASKITSGTIDIARLPAGVMERLKVVTNDTARFALTKADVQNGDCVKVTSTNKMYMVKDDTRLNAEAGYEEFSAGTAAQATNDSAGNNINSTYIKSLSVNGKVITYTKGNGTTGTITTQDTNTTYSNATTTTAGLMSSADKIKLNDLDNLQTQIETLLASI